MGHGKPRGDLNTAKTVRSDMALPPRVGAASLRPAPGALGRRTPPPPDVGGVSGWRQGFAHSREGPRPSLRPLPTLAASVALLPCDHPDHPHPAFIPVHVNHRVTYSLPSLLKVAKAPVCCCWPRALCHPLSLPLTLALFIIIPLLDSSQLPSLSVHLFPAGIFTHTPLNHLLLDEQMTESL